MPAKRPAEDDGRGAATPAKKKTTDSVFDWNNKAYKVCKKDEHVFKEIKNEADHREELLMERISELERALADQQRGRKTARKEDKNPIKIENYWELTWPLSKADGMGKTEAMSYLVLSQMAAEKVYDKSRDQVYKHQSNHSKLKIECAREQSLLSAIEARRDQWRPFNKTLQAKLKAIATLIEPTPAPEIKTEDVMHRS